MIGLPGSTHIAGFGCELEARVWEWWVAMALEKAPEVMKDRVATEVGVSDQGAEAKVPPDWA